MQTILTANHSHFTKDAKTVVLGFADDLSNSKEYILFQRNCRPTRQDKELGQDKVQVTINDQICASYGGLTSAEIRKDRIIFCVDDACAKKLRTDGSFQIILGPQCSDISLIKKAFAELYEGEILSKSFSSLS